MGRMLVLDEQIVSVEQINGRFTLIARDGKTDIFIPLNAEGADSLRADMNETRDTADQEAAVEGPNGECALVRAERARLGRLRQIRAGERRPISTNQRTVIVARVTGCDPRKRGSFLVPLPVFVAFV
jgi:hypothetical protein